MQIQYSPILACPSPSLAWARFWKSGDLEIQKFGIQKNKKHKSLKTQIRSAQNVDMVWISRKKDLEGPIWGHPRQFSPWTERNQKNISKIAIFLGGPMGPIHPVWGHVLVSLFPLEQPSAPRYKPSPRDASPPRCQQSLRVACPCIVSSWPCSQRAVLYCTCVLAPGINFVRISTSSP